MDLDGQQQRPPNPANLVCAASMARAANRAQAAVAVLARAARPRKPWSPLRDFTLVHRAWSRSSRRSRRSNCHDYAVVESFFSTVKSDLREHFESNGEAMELFNSIELFYSLDGTRRSAKSVRPNSIVRNEPPMP